MSKQSKHEAVTLRVVSPVEIEPGVVLPVGTYPGRSAQIGVEFKGSVVWSNPDITIALSELHSTGRSSALDATEYDITRFVFSGAIVVEPSSI